MDEEQIEFTNEYHISAHQARREAEMELRIEKRREAIDLMKKKLREERWWHKLFPWQISIRRR